MTVRIVWTAALMLLVCGVGSANAQDDPRVGLTMGYPGSIGVLWHVTDRIAIRPEIDFFRTRVTFESSGSALLPANEDEDTSRVIRPGVSALFYLGPMEDLRTYVSPRLVAVSTETSNSDQDSSNYLVSGSFGAQYRLGTRFAVFGEVGVEYSRGETRFSVPSPISGTTTVRRSGVASRSGVGVTLYF